MRFLDDPFAILVLVILTMVAAGFVWVPEVHTAGHWVKATP